MHLINDIETLKLFIPTVTNGTFDRYEGYLHMAEEWLNKNIIGQSLFDKLNETTHPILFKKCQDVVAHKGYMEAIPFLDLVDTGQGFAVQSETNLVPASAARVVSLRESIKVSLTDRIESLLEYLELATEFHDDWKASITYSLIYDSYIFNLTQFRLFAPFTGNRLDFIDAKPKMYLAIRLKIEPIISKELSDQIIEQLRDDDLSEDNARLIDNIRFAFAYFTIGDDKVGNSFINRARATIMKDLQAYPAFVASDLYAQILAQKSFSQDGPFLACGI